MPDGVVTLSCTLVEVRSHLVPASVCGVESLCPVNNVDVISHIGPASVVYVE